ncbi:MAG: hypothetical protein DRJ03_28720 [Chloroflexi bacterium]|nr:MAG: hypothetical protein DRJ03_28720 [Chloroflexota bacterium]
MANLLSDVDDKITFAINQYTERNSRMDAVEELFKMEFDIEQDVEDQNLELVASPRAQAILKMFQSFLAVGPDLTIQVLPQEESDEEQERCTKLERYLHAVRAASEFETGRSTYANFVFWFLFRGWGVFKTLFFPHFVDTNYFPIRILDRDPYNVYPVFGVTGPLYVVEKYDRYVGDIKRELRGLLAKKRDPEAVIWRMPDLTEYTDTDKVEVVEYWDTTNKGLRIAGQWVWLMPHHYKLDDEEEGIIPYAFAFCEETPLAEAEWLGRSVLDPLDNILRQQCILMSKVATATELFYYPQILVETPHGQSFVMSSAPGQVRPIPPGSKVTVLNPTPNQGLIRELMAWYDRDITLFGLPEAVWGLQPGRVQAGFAIAQLLSGVKTKLAEKANKIEMAMARAHEHVLRLTEIFAATSKKGGFEIYPAGDAAVPLLVTPEDVSGHYRNRVKISPDLPTDEALKWRIALMARKRDPQTKLPLVSDAYIREHIVNIKHPDVEEQRALNEFLETRPEIMEARAALFVHEWMKEHKAELEKMRRELEKMEAKERKKAEAEMEKKVLAAYREAVKRGEVPAPLMPPEAKMRPEELPPSFMGLGPQPAPPEEVPERVTEKMTELPPMEG